MSRWTHEEELKLLLIIVNQTNPKIDWLDVASKIGRTTSSISQHYEGIKKKASLELNASPPLATPTKRPRKTAKESERVKVEVKEESQVCRVKLEIKDSMGESDNSDPVTISSRKRARSTADDSVKAKKIKTSAEEDDHVDASDDAEVSWLSTIAPIKPENEEP